MRQARTIVFYLDPIDTTISEQILKKKNKH